MMKILKSAGRAAAFTAITLVLLEILLRLFHPCPWYGYRFQTPKTMLFQYDELLGWSGRPDYTILFGSIDFYHRVTLNEFGHRTSARVHDETKKNVIILGDSFSWGWGVANDEIASEVMMQENDAVNAYNLSAPGYGTDQEYLSLVRFLEANSDGEYDAVVLIFTTNDWDDIRKSQRYFYPKPRFILEGNELALTNVPVPDTRRRSYDSPRQLMRNHTFLNYSQSYNLIRVTLRRLQDPDFLRRTRALEEEPMPTSMETASRTALAIVSKINDLAKLRGAELHIVLFEPGVEWQWAALEQGLESQRISYSKFDVNRYVPSMTLWIDGHLNKYGHKKLAEHILSELDR